MINWEKSATEKLRAPWSKDEMQIIEKMAKRLHRMEVKLDKLTYAIVEVEKVKAD